MVVSKPADDKKTSTNASATKSTISKTLAGTKTPAAASAPKSTTAATKPASTTAKSTASTATTAKKTTTTATKTATTGAKKTAASGTAKKGTKTAGKATSAKDDAKTSVEVDDEPQLSPEEQEARAKKMQEEMEELRQKAWLAEVEYERKQEAKRRKKLEEEAKRKKEVARITKALLEAAFDGEIDDMEKLFKEGKDLFKNIIDVADGHGNTLLSEAAAGGSIEVVKMLLERGANPNSVGEFGRTPLWRAAFLGKHDVILDMLKGGCDPRISNESGEAPEHVAANAQMKELIRAWDTAETDRLVALWQSEQEEKRAQEAAAAQKKLATAKDEMEAAKKDADHFQSMFKKCHVELEKRISEYDTCVEERKPEELIQVALTQIKSAEDALKAAKEKASQANEKLQWAKLRYREEQAAQQDSEENAEELMGIPVELRDLDDILIKDIGKKIEGSGKWPLVIDTSEQASVFLRYADTNYVSALSAQAMEPNRLRRSLLGGFRYGKPVVLDFMECDLFDEAVKAFDKVQPNLMADLLTKKIMVDEKYLSLVRPGDGEEYNPNRFTPDRIQRFRFIVLTSARFPNESIVEKFYALRVKVKE